MRPAPLVVLALLLAGCAAPGEAPAPDVDLRDAAPLVPAGHVPFVVLREGTGALDATRFIGVIADQGAWESFWSSYNSTPLAPPPEVDFERQRVAVIALGEVGSTCNRVRVANVTRASDAEPIVVRYTREKPGLPPPRTSGMPIPPVCHAIPSQPHVMIAFWGAGEVTFDETVIRVDAPRTDDRIFFGVVAEGDHAPVAGPVERVLRNASEWETLAEKVADDVRQEPGLASYDYALVALGPRDNDCSEVELDSVTRDPATGAFVVAYTEILPDVDHRCDPDARDPYLVAFFDKGAPDVRFAKSTRRSTFGSLGHPVDAPYRLLGEGNHSALVREPAWWNRMEVVENASAWADVWARHANGSGEPAPEVDFERWQVVVYGFQPIEDCAWLQLENVTRSSTQGTLQVQVWRHPDLTWQVCAPRNPWLLVEVPRGPLGHLERGPPAS